MHSCAKLVWNPRYRLQLSSGPVFDLLVSRPNQCSRIMLLHTCTAKFRRKRDDAPKNPQQSLAASRQQPSQPQLNSRDPLSVFKPVMVKPNPDDINFGEEIAGKINKQAMLRELNRFGGSPEVKALSKEHGLDDYLYNQV